MLHLIVPAREHLGKQCPVANVHEWRPPQEGDSRSPCPALNTMANHGYIPRNGKKLGIFDLIRGLRACYGLSYPLAILLAVGGFILLRRIRPISLEHIGMHNAVEHNASLVHEDCPNGKRYAPIRVVPELLDDFMKEGCPDQKVYGSDENLMNVMDLSRFRVRREKECGPIDDVHAEIARGEMAIVFGMWGRNTKNDTGVPRDWLKDWFENDRLPRDWKPTHTQGLLDTIKRSKCIRRTMEDLRSGSTTPTSRSSTVYGTM
ncbi:hypothetical protein AX15_007026 [Amanita polypyramis BW_CC]|nr:hypothetical protein AX15_007026 [Amanita polypyramis BW_CC]